jgi:hypothetical protein
MDLLKTTRYAKSTDPRDKVFALLWMASDPVPLPFAADYTLTVEEVYTRLTRWYYLYGGLDIMSFACAPCTETKLLLPSWTPDWTLPDQFLPLCEVSRHFCAGGKLPVFSMRSIHGVASFGLLQLEGKIIDQIRSLLPHPESESTGVSMFQGKNGHIQRIGRSANFLRQSKEFAETLWETDKLSSEQYDRYWRTLIANSDDERNIAPPGWKKEFENFARYTCATPSEQESLISEWKAANPFPNHKYNGRGAFFIDCIGMEFESIHHIVARGRSFMSTAQRSSIGWAPQTAQDGDIICIFRGAETPFAVRPKPDSPMGSSLSSASAMWMVSCSARRWRILQYRLRVSNSGSRITP